MNNNPISRGCYLSKDDFVFAVQFIVELYSKVTVSPTSTDTWITFVKVIGDCSYFWKFLLFSFLCKNKFLVHFGCDNVTFKFDDSISTD